MILGAIDVGSNSVKLLIMREKAGQLRTLAHRLVITRLGSGSQTRRISMEAADRTLQVLADFKELADRLSCERLLAVGTEALRKATNAREFLQRCEYEAGLHVRIISGQEEAALSFRGATDAWKNRPLAAIDIGGGSTELMFGADGHLTFAKSLKLGCVSLTESALHSDPPTATECTRAARLVYETIHTLPEAIRTQMRHHGHLIGIGGTAVTAAAILAHRRNCRTVHAITLSHKELSALFHELAEVPLMRRREIEGLDPDRADVILAGLMILIETMKYLDVPKLSISKHGLRRGLILDTLCGRRTNS